MYFVMVSDAGQVRMATTWGERLFGKVLVTYTDEAKVDWVRADRVRSPTNDELRDWYKSVADV